MLHATLHWTEMSRADLWPMALAHATDTNDSTSQRFTWGRVTGAAENVAGDNIKSTGAGGNGLNGAASGEFARFHNSIFP